MTRQPTDGHHHYRIRKIHPLNNMIPISSSVRKILEDNPIETSAPCRIDSGGTWDIKAMALPLEGIEPVSVNMALNLRTRIFLSPYKDGYIRVSSDGFDHVEEYSPENMPFNTPFGLFFAIISYFNFHGLQVNIRSGSPIRSALGGSSTALVALIKAFSKLSVLIRGHGALSDRDILHLGYHLEDGISGGNCGIQDQAAAVYGGVNIWRWHYSKRNSIFHRESLFNSKGVTELSKRILVAYSGKSHVAADINNSWIKGFLSGITRTGWIEVNDIVNKFGNALKGRNYEMAAEFLKAEMNVRREITPDALIKITEKLIDQAEATGCGARFAGAGAGGSVWALGEPAKIIHLRKVWEATLAPIKEGEILDCTIDPVGVS